MNEGQTRRESTLGEADFEDAGAQALGGIAILGNDPGIGVAHRLADFLAPSVEVRGRGAVELAGAILRAGELPEPGEVLDFGRDAIFAVQRRSGGSRAITLLPSPVAPTTRGSSAAGAA